MKATGMIRKIDLLGRIVLPKELRKNLDLEEGTPMEIYVDDKSIILSKYEPCCIFCGEARDVIEYKGKRICGNCLKEIRK